MFKRVEWREELAIIDRTMKAISGVSDPNQLVQIYWEGIGELVTIDNYVSVSRRNVAPPFYLVTRSSRFQEEVNPWTQRDRLPMFQGGILGEIAYANAPVIIEDLASRLRSDDPAYFYLQGFSSAVAFPQYDNNEALNMTVMLLAPGEKLDHSMIPMMHWQSGLFGRGTQNLVLRNQLAGALAALDKELQAVGAIQRSLLPRELPHIPGFELAAHYLTSARAGGDYYDFFPLAGDAWGLFIADVSGHGTPAAVLMAITHAIAHGQPGRQTPPAALLAHLNEQLATLYTHAGTFVTAFYAILNPLEKTLTYSCAGHNPPRLVRGGEVVPLDDGSSLPLGILAGEGYGQSTIALRAGDVLTLYTDGITEAMPPYKGGEVRLFTLARLDELLLAGAGEKGEEQVERIRSAVGAFCRGTPTDDQTLIVIRCL